MKIKKGDTVIVIAGKDKGKTGLVTRAFPSVARVIVEGINLQKKHKKLTRDTKQAGTGQIIDFAAPIHVSNVMLYDVKAKKGSRVRIERTEKGVRTRALKKSGTILS